MKDSTQRYADTSGQQAKVTNNQSTGLIGKQILVSYQHQIADCLKHFQKPVSIWPIVILEALMGQVDFFGWLI